MLELLQFVYVLVDVVILAGLGVLLIFGFRGLCLPTAPRPQARHADPHYAHLLRKTSF